MTCESVRQPTGWPGTSMMKQWLIRRSVRIPPVFETTAPISSSV